jgi:hypothetical protein
MPGCRWQPHTPLWSDGPDAVLELYGLPPEQFTAARDQLAKPRSTDRLELRRRR